MYGPVTNIELIHSKKKQKTISVDTRRLFIHRVVGLLIQFLPYKPATAGGLST